MNILTNYQFYEDGTLEYQLLLEEKIAYIGGHTDGSPIVALPKAVVVDGKSYAIKGTRPRGFYNELSLEELYIPDGYKSLGPGSFTHCPKLKRIHLGRDFGSEICTDPMWRTCGILGYWDVDRTSLEEVIISPDNPYIKTSEDGTFILSKNGKRIVGTVRDQPQLTIPEGVTVIGLDAISLLSRLERLTIPEGVTDIDECGIGGNKNLSELHLPNSLDTISLGAFTSNPSLKTLVIPESVCSINPCFIFGCSSLQELTVLCEANTLHGIRPLEEAPTETCKLFVPAEKLEDFRRHRHWSQFKLILPIPANSNLKDKN